MNNADKLENQLINLEKEVEALGKGSKRAAFLYIDQRYEREELTKNLYFEYGLDEYGEPLDKPPYCLSCRRSY